MGSEQAALPLGIEATPVRRRKRQRTPEGRAKHAAAEYQRFLRVKDTPEFRAKKRESYWRHRDEHRARWAERYRTDPIFVERHRAKSREYQKRIQGSAQDRARGAKYRASHRYATLVSGWEYRVKNMIYAAKARAKKREIEFALSVEWGLARYTGTCELTGLPFVTPEGGRGPYTMSLDRIDPARGYLPDNCRIVLWAINSFKGDAIDRDMYIIAEALVGRRVEGVGDDRDSTPRSAQIHGAARPPFESRDV